MAKENKSNIIIYQSEDGQTHIEVQMDEDTVWLSQQQMADLYQTSRTNVVEHIKHIYEDGELVEESTCRKIRQVRQEGARMVEREIPHYNLDMIISLGYRINSIQATHFRQWATARLKEYIIKGFTMDDERLKQMGGGYYWKELLEYSDRKAHHFDLKNTSLNQASASRGEVFQFLFQPLTDEKQTALYRSHRQA